MNPMTPKRTRRLRARAATLNTHDEEFDDYGPEPNMKLSHAFMVVLLLHVIAVGGLYAFNSMKAGKQATPKLAKSSGTSASTPSQKENASSGSKGQKPEEPRNEPPSEQPKEAPIVAKIAESPKATTSLKSASAETKVDKAPAPSEPASVSTKRPGILASMKGSLQKAAGIGAAATTASAVTHQASAQDATNTDATTGVPNGSAATTSTESTSPLAAGKTYMVKAGDTVTRIASSVGVAIPDLEKANGLISNSVLQVGQILKVPEKAIAQAASSVSTQAGKVAATIATAATGVTGAPNPAQAKSNGNGNGNTAAEPTQAGMTEYTLVKGDNPWKIAKKFKISQEELMKANGITDPKKMQIGQKLMIPAPSKK
jgi:LysM repeat protein